VTPSATLRVRAPGFAAATFADVELVSEDGRDFALQAGREAAVEFRQADGAILLVEEASFSTQGSPVEHEVLEAGRFRLLELPPGTLPLQVALAGSLLRVNLAAGAGTQTILVDDFGWIELDLVGLEDAMEELEVVVIRLTPAVPRPGRDPSWEQRLSRSGRVLAPEGTCRVEVMARSLGALGQPLRPLAEAFEVRVKAANTTSKTVVVEG